MLLCDPARARLALRDQVQGVLLAIPASTQRIPQRANATICFPALVTTPSCPDHTLDGEVCVLGDIGRSAFECRALKRTRTVQT